MKVVLNILKNNITELISPWMYSSKSLLLSEKRYTKWEDLVNKFQFSKDLCFWIILGCRGSRTRTSNKVYIGPSQTKFDNISESLLVNLTLQSIRYWYDCRHDYTVSEIPLFFEKSQKKRPLYYQIYDIKEV